MEALTVLLDTAQTRVSKDRLSTLVTGEDWSRRFVDKVYVEPVTLCAMLQPLCMTAAWSTTGTGDYRRYAVADYNLTAAKWVDDPVTSVDNYIKGIDSGGVNNEVVTTKVNQPSNGAMYLSWFSANAGTDDMVAIECGWGTPDTAPISLRFFAAGRVEVWRYGVFAADYTLNGNQNSSNPQQPANQFVSVTIHPFRRRELLIISNQGGGCVHLFDDIDQYAADPTITPNLPFWWSVPSGLAKVACAPCLYAKSGYICGVKTFFASAPKTGSTLEQTTYHDANAGSASSKLVKPDDPNADFTPNSTDTVCRIRTDLTGNGVRTPSVYAARCGYKTITAQTPSESVTLDPFLVKASLEVPDNAADLRWSIDLIAPEGLATAGARSITRMSNRPVSFRMGSQVITNGITSAPKVKVGIDDKATHVSIEVRDKFKLLEHYLFTDPTPLDGMNIVDAFKLVFNAAGVPDDLLDLEATPFSLPKSDAPSKGDFAVLINPGDTAAEWINRLHENYCATWLMGWRPTASGWKFVLKSPESLGSTSVYTLYETTAGAIGAGKARADVARFTYRSYDEELLEPEANDIWVTGRDLRTGRPLVGHKPDTESQDPTKPKAARPDNWLGEVRKYGLYDGSITSQAAVNRAVDILFNRLTPQRIVAEFTTDFMVKPDGVPVWRGDVVTLAGRGDFRIKSFSTDWVREPDTSAGFCWRPTKYVAELVQAAASGMTSFSGLSLAQVVGNHELKSTSKSVVRKDSVSQELLRRMPIGAFAA